MKDEYEYLMYVVISHGYNCDLSDKGATIYALEGESTSVLVTIDESLNYKMGSKIWDLGELMEVLSTIFKETGNNE